MSQTRRRDATAPNNRMMPTTVRLRHSSCLLPLVASRLRERLWVDLTLTRLYAGGLPQIPRHPAKHRDSCSCTCPFSANSWLGPSQKQEDERGAIRRGGDDGPTRFDVLRNTTCEEWGSLIGEAILSRLPTVLRANLPSLTCDRNHEFISTFDRGTFKNQRRLRSKSPGPELVLHLRVAEPG